MQLNWVSAVCTKSCDVRDITRCAPAVPVNVHRKLQTKARHYCWIICSATRQMAMHFFNGLWKVIRCGATAFNPQEKLQAHNRSIHPLCIIRNSSPTNVWGRSCWLFGLIWMGCCCCCSRMLISPSMYNATMERSTASVLPSIRNVLTCSWRLALWCKKHLSPYGLHCPGHTVLRAQEGTGPYSPHLSPCDLD